MRFLCPLSDVPLNGCRRVVLGRRGALALFNLAGTIHALDDRCSHGDASLAAGDVDEGVVYCPLHAGGFDIATGAPVHPPCEDPVARHAVVVRDDGVWLDE